MKTIILLVILFLTICCSNRKLPDYTQTDIIINVEEALKQPVTDFQFTIDSSWLLALKTPDDKIQGTITKIKVHHQLIYTLDELQSKKLNVYDKQGRYIRSIGNIGKGPQELLNISDFCIFNDQIFLVDNIMERIQVFSVTTGEFQKTIPLPFRPHEMEIIDNNSYLFELSEYNQGRDKNFQQHYLVVTDSLFQAKDFFLSHPQAEDNSVRYISVNNPLNHVQDSFYYFSTVSDMIYHFSGDSLKPKIYFNFGNQYTIPTDVRYDDNKFMKYARHHDYAYFIESPVILENYIAGILRVNNTKFFILTDTQQCFAKEITQDNYNALDPVFCIGTYDNTLISTIDEIGLKQFKAKNIFVDETDNNNNCSFILFTRLRKQL